MKPHEETWTLDPKEAGVVLCPVPIHEEQRNHILMAPINGEPGDSRAKLAACAPEMARMLLALEVDSLDGDEYPACPVCGGTVSQKKAFHFSACAIDGLLKKAGVR